VTEEVKEKAEPLKLKNRFRIQIKKYWKYTKKWFPFALLIGGISGVLMALFTSLVVNMQSWLSSVPIYIKYPLVGGITTVFLFLGFKEVYGAGLSHVLAHKNTSTPMRARGILTKFVASALTLGVSAPAGREGPSVTIGSTTSSVIADKLGMTLDDENHAITIGAAACTAAVFHAPLGGTVFAAEVPYKRDLDETVFLPALVASAISFLVYNGLLIAIQKIPIFSESPVLLSPVTSSITLSFINSLQFLLFGIIAGFLGIGFSLLFRYVSKGFDKFVKNQFLPLIGISITAVLVFLVDDFWLPEEVKLEGTGFKSINNLLADDTIAIGILFVLLIGKIIVTSTCVGFGNSAGVMGPTLVSGAALGLLYSRLFPTLDPTAMMVIGMSAMHTSTTKTPIASMILVLEMVGFPNLIIPIILSNAMAFIISMDFSLYKGQIRSKEVILRRRIQYTDVLETLNVRGAMSDSYSTVKEDDLLEDTFSLLYLEKRSSMPVVDERGSLVGIISAIDYQQGFSKGKKLVGECMTAEVITAFDDETLTVVFDRLTSFRIECLPVVERKNPKKIIGLISFRDIETRYESELTRIHSKRSLTIEDLESEEDEEDDL
jgi:CIC family chloride channel protein